MRLATPAMTLPPFFVINMLTGLQHRRGHEGVPVADLEFLDGAGEFPQPPWPIHHHRHGSVEVGIVKDDERGVAAEFEPQFLDGRGALGHQQFADLGRAGEGERADDRCRNCWTECRIRSLHGFSHLLFLYHRK